MALAPPRGLKLPVVGPHPRVSDSAGPEVVFLTLSQAPLLVQEPRFENHHLGGCSLPPPTLDGEDPLPDLELLLPPPLPSDDKPPASMGAPFISDLEQLYLHSPQPPPQPLVEGPQFRTRLHNLGPAEEELLPTPEEPVGFAKREASTDICAFCRKTVRVPSSPEIGLMPS